MTLYFHTNSRWPYTWARVEFFVELLYLVSATKISVSEYHKQFFNKYQVTQKSFNYLTAEI